ncbi:MAG: hypothetical protein RI917_179 [Actinomycetota bacterium]|jgi:hypothetical protein
MSSSIRSLIDLRVNCEKNTLSPLTTGINDRRLAVAVIVAVYIDN